MVEIGKYFKREHKVEALRFSLTSLYHILDVAKNANGHAAYSVMMIDCGNTEGLALGIGKYNTVIDSDCIEIDKSEFMQAFNKVMAQLHSEAERS